MPRIKTIKATSHFVKSLKKLPRNIQEQFQKKDQNFRENPFVPSLKTHALKGKLKGLYSYSISHSYRVLFEFVNDIEVIYFDVGTHEIYR